MLFCSFGYRGKVIIKCVSNIVGNGYNIESDHYQERKSRVGMLDATVFREMRDLIPFRMFLTLFQFFSKYLS